MRKSLSKGVVVAALSVSTITGCATFKTLWQEFEANPVQVTGQYITYVQTFLQGVETVWTMIAPFIGAADAQQANTVFNNAVLTLENALTALQAAVQAAVVAGNSSPDLTALTADVTQAVDAIVAIINQYKTPTASAKMGVSFDLVTRQQAAIHSWRH